MENTRNHGGNGFMNGFLLGIIIGAALVFFLGTEKGKRMLKTITEEGLEGASELREILDTMDEEAMEEKPKEVIREEAPAPSRVKRFFRGVPKRAQ